MITKSIISILIFLSAISHLFAQNSLPKIETNRLKSTGGAGVASVLLEEAAFLNPASSAFFNLGSVYLQKSTHDFDPERAGEDSLISVVASDSTGPNSGSLSYNKLKSGENTVTQFGLSYATPIGKKSALGFSYNRRKEDLLISNVRDVKSYNITNFGIIHNVSEKFSFGLVVEDLLREIDGNSRVLFGGQYSLGQYINFMLDVGSDYKENLSEKFLWRSSIQVRVFNDFFIRFGAFDDNGRKQNGNGIGIAWVQPKLSIEASIKNTEFEDLTQTELKETTFSVSYRF